MAQYSPVYLPGASITLTASATVTGGQLLEVSGNGTVGPAGAASAKVVGVAGNDGGSGDRITVHPRATIHEAVASGSITAGDQLGAAAAGQVSTVAAAAGATAGDINTARSVIGVALTTVTTGNKVRYIIR